MGTTRTGFVAVNTKTTLRIPSPLAFVDSHVHIMGGRATPAPLLWASLPDFLDGIHPSRQFLDRAMEVYRSVTSREAQVALVSSGVTAAASGRPWRACLAFLSWAVVRSSMVQMWRGFVELSASNTPDVTRRACALLSSAIGEPTFRAYRALRVGYDDALGRNVVSLTRERLFPLLMAMPMDMEFAHIAGYDGWRIYEPKGHIGWPGSEPKGDVGPEFFLRFWGAKEPPWPAGTRIPPHYPGVWRPLLGIEPIKSTDEETAVQFLTESGRPVPTGPSVDSRDDQAGSSGPLIGNRPTGSADQCVANEDDREMASREEIFRRYETWPTQERMTRLAATLRPWTVLPLYHADPRRLKVESDPKLRGGHLVRSVGGMAKVQRTVVSPKHKDRPGIYVGIKLYTALGYRPLDTELESVQRKMYRHCQDHDIPIVNHCTPQGFPTRDRELYRAYEWGRDDPGKLKKYLEWMEWQEYWNSAWATAAMLAEHGRWADLRTASFGEKPPVRPDLDDEEKKEFAESAVDYFNRNFVAPRAWWPVLTSFPRLKLCLAHFGGDVTTDSTRPRDVKGVDAVTQHEEDPGQDLDLSLVQRRGDAPQCQQDGWPGEDLDLSVVPRRGDAPQCQQDGWPGGDLDWFDQIVFLLCSFPRVHVDLSYFPIDRRGTKKEKANAERLLGLKAHGKWDSLKRRILFGTDWWMTEKSLQYQNFCEKAHRTLDEIGPDMWLRATCVNPLKFFNLPGVCDQVKQGYHAVLATCGTPVMKGPAGVIMGREWESKMAERISREIDIGYEEFRELDPEGMERLLDGRLGRPEC